MLAQRMTQTKEYRAWINMISRCENPNTPFFKHYGGRGIRICSRWRSSFDNFYADMGLRPTEKHSLDRIDPNGDYEPENCRWATSKQQTRNFRNANKVFGVSVHDLAERNGLKPNTVVYRLRRGWTPEQAVSIRPQKGRRP